MATAPHIANLRKRAKALGLVITKANDAWWNGNTEYVLHTPQQDWEHMEMYTLYGIAALVKEAETR